MILFLTTADTEILAASRARDLLPADFPEIRCANPAAIADPDAYLASAVPAARAVVVRLLGGRRAWTVGLARLEHLCAAQGVPLLAFGGEAHPDAEMVAASTVPPGVVADAFEYLRQGGVVNLANFFRLVADTVLNEGFGFEPPEPLPEVGAYRPELLDQRTAGQPTVGIVFYRSHFVSGNTEFVDVLVDALQAAGANPLPVFCYSLRPDEGGHVAALDLLADRIDALIVTVLASGSASSEDGGGDSWEQWEVPQLEQLAVPVIQGLCVTTPRAEWERSEAGLTPLDVAMQVAIPEFDGRVIGPAFSFKEPLAQGSPVSIYRADPERAARLAQLALRFAQLRRKPNGEKRIAILLSNYPSKNSRIGNAVGLDTPASAVRLLDALRDRGYHVEGYPRDGDTLVHALIAAGGNDREFLTRAHLQQAEGRVSSEHYRHWFDALPEALSGRIREKWGDPPGNLYVDGGAIVVAGLRFGNVFVGIQPPRGFGENPIAIYHDPDLPPSHHYLATYWWLDREFQADAIIHLGKHGTLEWLPGKSVGLSQACAPDALIADVPLFYPFIVNDPGEGTQAKRRAHAVIVDHMVPAMMRAETYDDLARLEQLLDTYAQVQSLDPGKLPLIRAQIWALVRAAELHHDLGVQDEPQQFDAFIRHLDGYLCEIKDIRIKDGLHVLGDVPQGKQRIGLLGALLRLGTGRLPGLRAAVASAFQLDEQVLVQDLGQPATAPAALLDRFPGPAATAGDLVDRLEEASQALLHGMDAADWDPSAAEEVVRQILDGPSPQPSPARTPSSEPGSHRETSGFALHDLVSTLAFAAREVIPRLDRCTDEIDNLLAGLDGRFVPAGPSGSPTRGALNVLPTGRNFYSVDPKALPSRFAWETGQRLADDVLQRYLRDEGGYPETVGIVVWGTSAMRTQGDDLGEILALLGVRPVWDEASQRITGLETIPLTELGRPRIDVTVRISGFFRDAFPNLITLMDDAVQRVASLDEPDEQNFVAKHARAERQAGADVRASTTRVFGSKPGAYGAGLLPLIDARNWRTDADLAKVYEVWGGYAYGRGLDGAFVPAVMQRNFARVRLAVKNVDNREHDVLDSDDYFQYHGGMVAVVRALTGANPRAYVADSSNPSEVQTRALSEEIRRVFRARVANPRWISSMMRHGYKGAFEFSATVDYLFGYDASTGMVDDWMYGALAEKYVLDAEVAAFMKQSNPWALRAITERLLEAADRGLWADPDPQLTDQLQRTFLELDGQLEPR